MKIKLAILGILLFHVSAFCEAPSFATFATSGDSSIYIIWYHRALHNYEQGFDSVGEPLIYIPGQIDGTCCLSQKIDLPPLSYIYSFDIAVLGRDAFPEFPGDQFTPFRANISRDDGNNYPQDLPVRSDINFLCGQSCDGIYTLNPLDFYDGAGEAMWFGMQWSENIATAPQLFAFGYTMPEHPVRLSVDYAGNTDWYLQMRVPRFKQCLLMPFTLAVVREEGWRNEVESSGGPDGFAVQSFAGDSSSELLCATDSLICNLPVVSFDSVKVITVNNGNPETEGLVIAFDNDKKLPIDFSWEYAGSIDDSARYDLSIVNISEEELNLAVGGLVGEGILKSRRVGIVAGGSDILSFDFAIPEIGETGIILIVEDIEQERYPVLIKCPLVPGDPTDAEQQEMALPEQYFYAFPNPASGEVRFAFKRMVGDGKLIIYNILGQKVARLFIARDKVAVWDGKKDDGSRAASGIYLAQYVDSFAKSQVVKLILLR